MIATVSGVCVCACVKALVNSTMTPNMTFTKTSQKFGQWADHRVNTIYGLGFSSEVELIKVRASLLQQQAFIEITGVFKPQLGENV